MIHHAVELERRVRLQLGYQCHVRLTHQLVGHQHPAHAGGIGGTGLHRSAQGHAPGALLQLAAKQGRGHAGFAVRGQHCAAAGYEVLHPANVVFQRRTVDHQRRQADVTQQIVGTFAGALGHQRSIEWHR